MALISEIEISRGRIDTYEVKCRCLGVIMRSDVTDGLISSIIKFIVF
jgi:hypothetical protein